MSRLLFTKPKDMRWVDLAIWIDNNIYNDNCDYNTAYQYLWLLSYMLAAKQKFFSTQKDYEEFSSLLAYNTYERLTCKDKPPVKSVLNYMKSIIFFRKGLYEISKHQKIIDPKYDNWDSVSYVEKCKSAYEASNRGDLFEGVKELFNVIPNRIRYSIPKVYRTDKRNFENIYISCLLTMLNRITLPAVYEDKLEMKLNSSPNFDEIKYYKKYLDDDIILWHLPHELSSVVVVTINKVNASLVGDIKDLSDDIKVSDSDFSKIMASGFTTGGSNETDY